MRKKLLLLLTLLLPLSANADLNDDARALCGKIKSCAVIELNKQLLSPDEKSAILGIYGEPCIASVNKNEKAIVSAGLENQAKACLNSLETQSCSVLLDSSGKGAVTTPVCTEFEGAAKAAGINLGQ